jgi:hypothetical protein
MDLDQFSSFRINDLSDILFCELAIIWACPYVKTPGRAFRYKSSQSSTAFHFAAGFSLYSLTRDSEVIASEVKRKEAIFLI